mmetsp:Transcript_20565/g.57126  ORF Transcript_20565/g.57126 Transcript_20565/m.57126 type:complete len:243 (+) Transcript_20565:219-947(+)
MRRLALHREWGYHAVDVGVGDVALPRVLKFCDPRKLTLHCLERRRWGSPLVCQLVVFVVGPDEHALHRSLNQIENHRVIAIVTAAWRGCFLLVERLGVQRHTFSLRREWIAWRGHLALVEKRSRQRAGGLRDEARHGVERGATRSAVPEFRSLPLNAVFGERAPDAILCKAAIRLVRSQLGAEHGIWPLHISLVLGSTFCAFWRRCVRLWSQCFPDPAAVVVLPPPEIVLCTRMAKRTLRSF